MLFIAFTTIDVEDRETEEIRTKAQRWWNEGERPEGLVPVANYGAIGTDTPNVLVFECDDPNDIQKLVDFWAPVHIEVHPAIDLAEKWRKQGMDVA